MNGLKSKQVSIYCLLTLDVRKQADKLPYSVIPLLGIYPKKTKALTTPKDTRIPTFTAGRLIGAKLEAT